MRKGVLHLALINLTLMLGLVGLATWLGGVWGLAASLVILWFAWYKVLPVSNLIAWQYDRLFFHGKKLKDLKPSEKEHKKAYDIGTWLFGLSKKQIELLSKEAEWKVMMQVRLYLPMLLS